MSVLSSRELIVATHEFTDLCFDHVERKLGLSAIAMARDQDDLALTTLLSLEDNEYDAWKLQMQDVESDTPATSDAVITAEYEFTERIFAAAGHINDYVITGVESGRIDIMRTIKSDDADLVSLTIAAQLHADGTVKLTKRKQMIILKPRSARSEVVPVTSEDYETFEQLFHGLVRATQTAKTSE